MGFFNKSTPNPNINFIEGVSDLISNSAINISDKLFTLIDDSGITNTTLTQDNKNQISLEMFCICYHIVDRVLFDLFTPAERDYILNIIDRDTHLEYLGKINSRHLDAELRSIINTRQYDYGQCQLISEQMTDTVFWELGKRVADTVTFKDDIRLITLTLSIARPIIDLMTEVGTIYQKHIR